METEKHISFKDSEIKALKEAWQAALDKVVKLEKEIFHKDESILMAAEVISAKENEVAELTGALEEANLEINRLRSEVKELRVA